MLMPILGSDIEKRRKDILKVAGKDLELGFLYAEFNFEWIVRRMILCFSRCPIVVIKAALRKASGYNDYERLWKLFVCSFDSSIPSIEKLLNNGDQNISENLKLYIVRRHVLVHGVKGGIGDATAICGISTFLKAAERLVGFAKDNKIELFKRLKPRSNRHCVFERRDGIEKLKNECNTNTCSTSLIEQCPVLNIKETAKAIRKHLREKSLPVAELSGLNQEDIIRKVQSVAEELGIADKTSVKKAIDKLIKSPRNRNNSLSSRSH